MPHHSSPRSLPTRTLREHPDLEQLKTQAKEMLEAFRAGDADATAEVHAHFSGADCETFALHDAQLVLARCYGFDSWPKLKACVDGVTVRGLVEAVRAGDLTRVRAMLEARPELASLDLAENNEHRALHYAVFARSPDMVKLLMEYSADARQGIYPHRAATAPLTIARERGYTEIVAVIEEQEAGRVTTPSALDRLGQLLRDGEEDRAVAMLKADPALARHPGGTMLLHLAAGAAQLKLTTWLLEHGVEVNTRGARGFTALDRAVRGRAEIEPVARLLLAHGAEMTARGAVALGDADWLRQRHAEGALEAPLNWPNDGLLSIAVVYDRPEILKLLLDFGFDPNERVRVEGVDEVVYSAGSPLWHCADAGKIAMAAWLLEHNADPNVHVYAWGPPLYRAYFRKDQAMIQLMMRHGGVLSPSSIGFLHEKDLARQMLADEAAGRLPQGILECGNASEDLLSGAGDPDILRMALPGVCWARDDERWYGVLLEVSSPDCLRLLLDRCDPNLRHPRFGRTILHDLATRTGGEAARQSPLLAAVLLDAGANIGERDDVLRSTPLGWACRWGARRLVQLLLERGADPVEADAEPWAAPRAWAEKMGHADILALLRDRGSPK